MHHLQELVGGYIEALPIPAAFDRAARGTCYVNGDGKYSEVCAPNRRATDFLVPGVGLFVGDYVAGTMVLVGFDPETGEHLPEPPDDCVRRAKLIAEEPGAGWDRRAEVRAGGTSGLGPRHGEVVCADGLTLLRLACSDIAEVASWWADPSTLDFTDDDRGAEQAAKWLSDPGEGQVHLCAHNAVGAVVGLAVCRLQNGECLLDLLVVAPQARGQGLGRALAGAVGQWARLAGARRVVAELVHPENVASRAALSAAGFEEHAPDQPDEDYEYHLNL